MSVMTDMRSEVWSQWSESSTPYGAEGDAWRQPEAPHGAKRSRMAGSMIDTGSVMRQGPRTVNLRHGVGDPRDTAMVTTLERGLTVNAVNNQFGPEKYPDNFFIEGQMLAVLYYPDVPSENNFMIISEAELQHFGKPVLGSSKRAFVIPMVVVEHNLDYSICCVVQLGSVDSPVHGAMGREFLEDGVSRSRNAVAIDCLFTDRSIRLFNLRAGGTDDVRSKWGSVGNVARDSSRDLSRTPVIVDLQASFVLYWNALVMDMGSVEDASLDMLLDQRRKIHSSNIQTPGIGSSSW